VFTFHRPETFLEWSKQYKSLRTRLHDIPLLPEDGLRDCQITAINNLEKSFKDARPKALIQMATASGKTFTAISIILFPNEFVNRYQGKISLYLVPLQKGY